MAQWLMDQGPAAVFAGLVYWELRKMRIQIPEWMSAIHSRLGSLGAETLAPPIVSDDEQPPMVAQAARRRAARK